MTNEKYILKTPQKGDILGGLMPGTAVHQRMLEEFQLKATGVVS